MARRTAGPDWRAWLEAWDRQQEDFNPDRERRFDAMLDVLAARLPSCFTALDLGCGPGSLTQRLLRRFPRARCVAVDFDPVVLRVGREALRSYRTRVTWVDASLGTPGWTWALPQGRFDAVVSTTALHWLDAASLRRLYRDLGRLLRPRGVFLDGDTLPWPPERKELRRLAERVRKVRFGNVPLRSERSGWSRWWEGIEKLPALREEVQERARRAANRHPHTEPLPLDVYERALHRAGFGEVEVVWQDLENRVLLAIR